MSRGLRRFFSKTTKTIMKSHKLRIPKYNLPIRFRPWFLAFTCVIMAVLAVLAFTNFHEALPLPDKILHFLCFFVATGVFYFIIDADESARRIWFWRNSSLLFTIFTCMFCAGILSEFIQAALPFKTLELGDIVANLLGATLGLWSGFSLERYYRHRREIARLYRPVSATVSEFEEDDDDDTGLQLLPTHVNHNGKANTRLTDVWDEREELFGIGDESDDEHGDGATAGLPKPETPRIVISHS